MKERFYLTRVRILSSDDADYEVGKVYCAIADREELNVNLNGSQPFGILHTPIDAARVTEIIAAANQSGLVYILTDPKFIDWVIKGYCDCEEV